MFQKTPAIQVFVKPFCISLNQPRVKMNLAASAILGNRYLLHHTLKNLIWILLVRVLTGRPGKIAA